MELFACNQCGARPQPVAAAGALLAIVRHQLSCPVLLAQVQARYAEKPATLPPTPPPRAFSHVPAVGKITRDMCAAADKRRADQQSPTPGGQAAQGVHQISTSGDGQVVARVN